MLSGCPGVANLGAISPSVLEGFSQFSGNFCPSSANIDSIDNILMTSARGWFQRANTVDTPYFKWVFRSNYDCYGNSIPVSESSSKLTGLAALTK
ncbi:hypothetical protein TNCV_3395631 [Trichonephila clavipes]|nr:hypothetical protein TNCV_3395631 [Trichonephila clavipes]